MLHDWNEREPDSHKAFLTHFAGARLASPVMIDDVLTCIGATLVLLIQFSPLVMRIMGL